MLHAPTSESKRHSNASRTAVEQQQAREFSPHLPGAAGYFWAGSRFARLHGMYGNQAVLRMLSPSTPTLQAKLTVNQPGDPFEREADRVADQVMRMTEPSAMQRQCNSCAEEHKLQRKCAECEEEEKKTGLQRKETSGAPQFAPPSVHQVLNSPGRPLDPATRAFMEPRFGYDFSRVRIHHDQRASESARAVRALAYTAGKHIVFSAGQYVPSSVGGQQLIAHELAHVVQQGFAASRPLSVQRQPADNAGGTQDQRDGATPLSTGKCYTCQIPGGLGICCYGAGAPIIPECLDLGKRTFDSCKGPWATCNQQAQCAQCQCIAAKAGDQYCQCTGMV